MGARSPRGCRASPRHARLCSHLQKRRWKTSSPARRPPEAPEARRAPRPAGAPGELGPRGRARCPVARTSGSSWEEDVLIFPFRETLKEGRGLSPRTPRRQGSVLGPAARRHRRGKAAPSRGAVAASPPRSPLLPCVAERPRGQGGGRGTDILQAAGSNISVLNAGGGRGRRDPGSGGRGAGRSTICGGRRGPDGGCRPRRAQRRRGSAGSCRLAITIPFRPLLVLSASFGAVCAKKVTEEGGGRGKKKTQKTLTP